MAVSHKTKLVEIDGFGLLAIVLFLAIVGLLVGGGLYFNETKKQAQELKAQIESKNGGATDKTDKIDTSTWKTYTNAQYGFSFKYPPSLTFKSAGETVIGVAPHQWWATFRNASEEGSLGLLITENTPVDVNARTIAQGPGGESQVSTKQVMVGTKTGIQFDASYEGESSTGVRVPLGNHLLGISFSSLKDDMFYANSVLIEQILSTFKFIK